MKRWLPALIPLVALGVWIGWRLNAKQVEAGEQTKQRQARSKTAPLVSVTPAEVNDVVQTYEAVGNVEAPLNVPISPKIAGRIDLISVQEGDRVTQGKVLVQLDPREVESGVRQAQATLAETQFRLAQAQINQSPTNVTVTSQIRHEEAALASARADFEQVKENYIAQQASAAAMVTDAQGRLDSAEASITNAEASIRSAQANLDNAHAKFNRINDLYKQGFIAAQDVDDAKTAVSVQQGALDVTKGQLTSAKGTRDSAVALKQSAERQADIVKTKGRADIAAASAKVTQALAALDVAKANSAQKPAYQANLDALKSSVEAASASLRSAKARRTEMALLSPLNGYVTRRYMDPGAMATPGQAVLAVQAIKQVWVSVPVPENVSRRMYIGQTARVDLDALPETTLTGKIVQVNPSADPQSRQFQVRVTLNNAQNRIKPGMFGRVVFETERVRGAVTVPREAVQQDGADATVLLVNADSVAQRRKVKLGASDTNRYAILEGVLAGDNVVTMSAGPVKDGTTVRLTDGKQKP